MNMKVTPVFSKVIYEKQLDLNTKNIISLIDVARKPYAETQQFNRKDLYVLETEKFKFLENIILDEFRNFSEEVLKYTNDFKITTSWFTVVDKEKEGQIHSHHNCMYSGVLYLQVNDDTGNIVFTDFNDKRNNVIPSEYNIFNSREWRFTPTNGLLLFFPSEMYHSIEKNQSNMARHSLAFNIIPIGVYGDGDSHYESKETL